MPDRVDEEIASLLRECAVDADSHPEVDPAKVLARGRRSLRRRRAVLASAAVVVVAVAGTSLGSVLGRLALEEPKPEGPIGRPTQTPTAPEEGKPNSPFDAPVVPCSEAPRPPQAAEVNTNLDMEGGYLNISFLDPVLAQDREYTIAYRADQSCGEIPWLADLIDHAVAAAQ